MMKKILYIMMGVGMLFVVIFCEDFLDIFLFLEVDVDFVFFEVFIVCVVFYNVYEKWCGNVGVYFNGVFYDLVVCGFDVECYFEVYVL